MGKFDARYNSPSGKSDPEPYSKAEGAEKVAKAMRKERDPGHGQFRIGEKNHARTCR